MIPFRDEYTDFTFNGITSEQMKVWITNSRDIQFRLTPEFSDTFVSPAFSNSSVLTGTNITKSTFKIKCIAIDITMSEWRAIQRWLSPEVVGRLEFDFNYNTYYNAKITKCISGTTFVRGRYDHVIGDLYIVNFDLEFTTVDDYAALGPVNVAAFNKIYSLERLEGRKIKTAVITGDTSVTTTTLDDGFLKIDNLSYDKEYSITYSSDGSNSFTTVIPALNVVATSNNSYFLPMVTPESSVASNLGRKTVLITSTTGATLPAGKSERVEGYLIKPGYYKKNAQAGTNYMSAFTVFSCGSAGGLIEKYEIRGGEEGLQNTNVLYYTIKVEDINTTNQSGIKLNIFSDDIYYLKVNGSPFDMVVTDNNDCYHICNTGVYELYPDITIKPKTSNVKFVVAYDNEDYYSYTYKVLPDRSVTINGRHGLILSGNSLVDEAYVYSYDVNTGNREKKRMFDTTKKINLGIMSIPSGNPEFLKIKVLDKEDLKITAEASNYSILTIETDSPLQYSHTHTVMHVFKDINFSTTFNREEYPLHEPQTENAQYVHSFVGSSVLCESSVFRVDNYKYMIIGPTTEMTNITKNSNYYLSLCDADVLQLDGEGFIYLQTRGAL